MRPKQIQLIKNKYAVIQKQSDKLKGKKTDQKRKREQFYDKTKRAKQTKKLNH